MTTVWVRPSAGSLSVCRTDEESAPVNRTSSERAAALIPGLTKQATEGCRSQTGKPGFTCARPDAVGEEQVHDAPDDRVVDALGDSGGGHRPRHLPDVKRLDVPVVL